MRKIIVTPAGRKKYLEILYEYLKSQKSSFEKWLLLVNTNDIKDIGFCERLAARNEDWIETCYAEGSDPNLKNLNIHKFLNEFCSDENCVYLRLDDDVVYLAPGFVKSMFEFRLQNPEYFLVYGNIINNAILSWIHQKRGAFSYEQQSKYECMDDLGWKDPHFAEAVHRAFLSNPNDEKWLFDKWILTEFERCSINAVCWFGKDLKKDPVHPDEEKYLSCELPRALSRPNIINGLAVCAHFAFGTQRDHLDSTDVLELYKKIAEQHQK